MKTYVSSAQDFFFELLRYSVTGFSPDSEVTYLEKLPTEFTGIFTRHIPSCSDGSIQLFIDHLMPQKVACLESSFNYESCLSDGELYNLEIDSILTAFAGESQDSKIPDSGEELLASLDNRGELENPLGEKDGLDEKIDVLRIFTDENGRLRRSEFGDEQLSVQKSGSKTLISNYADSLIVRRLYDEKLRLEKKTTFSMAAEPKNSAKISEKTFYYGEGGSLPVASTEEDFSGKKVVESFYDGEGRLQSRNDFHRDENDGLVADKKSLWVYTEGNKLLAEKITFYLYAEKEISGRKKKSVKTVTEKKIYNYEGAGGENPDVSFFEDDSLRMQTVYSSPENYTVTTYFDGDFKVQTFYEKGMKTEEIFFAGEKELKRRNLKNEN